MSFSAGGRGLRRGRDDYPVQEVDDDAEHSVEEGEEDVEEEEEGEEDEEEEEQQEGDEEEEEEEGEDEAADDDDRTPDQEDADEDDDEEPNANDTADPPQDLDHSLEDDPRTFDGSAADESYVEDEEEGEEEEEVSSPSPPPASAPASAPFTFAPLAPPPASTASSFPGFSIGSAASTQASSTPFSFSASSSSTPFSFPSTAALSTGLSSASAGNSTPFTFGAAAAAPAMASSTPIIFSSTASQPPPTTSAFSSFTATPSVHSSASSTSTAASTSAPATSSTAPTSASTPSSASASGGVIPVPVAARGVAGVWGAGSELYLYPNAESNKLPSRHHPPIPFHGSDIFRFQWPPLYGESTVLLHSWHGVFLNVQQQVRVQATRGQRKAAAGLHAALSPLEWRDFLLAQSHCYRAELDACLYRAAKTLTSASTSHELARHRVSADEYHAHLLLLESAASTWHLFELVCLDSHENLTVQLVDWLQRSTPAPHTQGLQVDSDEWWTALLHLLVQGRLPVVVDLLMGATASSSSPFSFLPSSALRQLVELLQTLPSLTAHATSVHHLVSLIHDYQQAVQHLAASTSAFQSHPYLPGLLSILAGDEAALAAVCDDWTQLVVAHLIFVQPQTSKQDLPDLVQRCVEAVQAKDREEGRESRAVPLLAQLRQHVLCFRVHSAVLLADQIFELPFFTAHLVDLLHLAGAMPTLKQAEKPQARRASQQPAAADGVPEVEMTPRDWYLWQYVNSIQHHDRLWTLTLDYMKAIGAGAPTPTVSTMAFSPIHAQCSLVLSQPYRSSKQLLQLLSLCAAHQLPPFVSERLCERFANLMLRETQTGAAVYWYERSGESGHRRIREIATRLLDRLIVGGDEHSDGRMDDGVDGGTGGESAAEDDAAMEAVLDNVSDKWLHEETGCVEVVLLQQWREFALIRRQLREVRPLQSNGAVEPIAPLNIFQQGRVESMQDDGDDRREGSDDDRLALTQSAITLLISLLTEPLLHPPHGPLLYTPQSLHPSLLRELSGLVGSIDVSKLLSVAECSVMGWQAALNALNRCELSWRWTEWRKRAGLSVSDVSEARARLLSCLQSAVLTEESAKRVNVRV